MGLRFLRCRADVLGTNERVRSAETSCIIGTLTPAQHTLTHTYTHPCPTSVISRVWLLWMLGNMKERETDHLRRKQMAGHVLLSPFSIRAGVYKILRPRPPSPGLQLPLFLPPLIDCPPWGTSGLGRRKEGKRRKE